MYEHERWTVELPRTARAWRDGEDVAAVIEDELSDNAHELVGEDACSDSGGWPDDEQAYVNDVEVTPERIVADVTVSFEEVRPTGCKDMTVSDSRDQRVVVTLKRGHTRATIEYSDSEPDNWDVADSNSAGDGT